MSDSGFIPDWPAPKGVQSFVSYRKGGHSVAPYLSNNLATHVGDKPEHVLKNRGTLSEKLQLKAKPIWLEQVHGSDLVVINNNEDVAAVSQRGIPKADGSIARDVNTPCVVLTADCLPLLFADERGQQVAAIHCGWKGLAAGLIKKTVTGFACDPAQILVYLGPGISQEFYEVDGALESCLAKTVPNFSISEALENKPNRYRLDLYALAKAQLQLAGVTQVFGGDRCVFCEDSHFYSYRREGVTGRMATLIWLS